MSTLADLEEKKILIHYVSFICDDAQLRPNEENKLLSDDFSDISGTVQNATPMLYKRSTGMFESAMEQTVD